ncbi:UBC-like protein [Guyanagaster necrorhizus]|uniref:UBC-like protein n=1 Tax=Guyanagaster necrorhizus TaxID=856835 RepID=A0A9P7W585_9AGAR|nr:UBC-like protein [Guyanagaster necrorhizus MCA 3950]KAG7452695.1 UBC-like protein [Guyanagaster necrorhizus MCA 3950]
MSALNKNNSAVKRIMQEARELSDDPSTDYAAGPLEDDIFEWHCTLRGPAGTEFEGGLYHVRILLPAEYPFRPPSLMILTPNGRFELNTKICISFTNYHEELWQPAWGVRTAILGLQGFFPLKGQAAAGVGSVEYPALERKRLAALSRDWVCPHCQQSNLDILPDPPAGQENRPSSSVSPPVESALPPEHNDASSTNSVSPRSEEAEDEVAQETSLSMPERFSSPTVPEHETHGLSPQPQRRPPVLLDTAICFFLVLVFALLCRKMI